MNRALLLTVIPLVLAACVRAPQPPAQAGTPSSAPTALPSAQPAAPNYPPDERVLYYPSRDRVLTNGDESANDMQWRPVGLGFAALQGKILHGLLLTDTELTDRDGNSQGTLLPAGSRVQVREATEWVNDGTGFHRLYRVESPDRSVRGWVQAFALALILAEANGLEAGIIARKIVIGGGESEYSLLVVASGNQATVMDTSYLPFPDGFHPSGILSISLEDVNADSRAEIIVEAETILSLRYLGATPVRWKAWLRRGADGALIPIFRYNTSFGSDAGYSYTARDRLFDSTGGGLRDMVRVDTDYTIVSGPEEFATTTVSFYPWNGSQFRHETLQDLPKLGMVTSDHAALRAGGDEQSAVVATLARGDQLYVYDRSDARQSRDDPASWWYRAVSKSGVDGWIRGTFLDLSWIDPLKTNRAVFLAQNPPRS